MMNNKNFFSRLIFFMFFVIGFLPVPVWAATFKEALDGAIFWGNTSLGLSSLPLFLTTGVTGASVMGNIVSFVTSLALYLSTLAIIIGGVMYTVAWGDESKVSRAKNIILYAIVGYGVVLIVKTITTAVTNLLSGTYTGATVAAPFVLIIDHVVGFVSALIAVLAVLAIIIGAYQYLASFGDESKAARGKQTIIYAIIALLITGLTGAIADLVDGILTSSAATTTATKPFKDALINTVTAVLAPLSLIAVIALVFGGYTYITAAGDEQKTSTAKKVIVYAIAGIMLIMVSAAIVNIILVL